MIMRSTWIIVGGKTVIVDIRKLGLRELAPPSGIKTRYWMKANV